HVNCRCTEGLTGALETAGDYEGHAFHGNQWTGGQGGDAHSYFKPLPTDFSLKYAEYDIHTKYPRDAMVVANVPLDLISSGYGNDYRVREMSSALQKGAKLPPLTLELKE